MPDSLDPLLSGAAISLPILVEQRLVKRCHIYLPDMLKPVSAISYQGRFYSYVRFFADLASAQRAGARLAAKGDTVVFTQVAKGFVLWVYEAEAHLASKPVVR